MTPRPRPLAPPRLARAALIALAGALPFAACAQVERDFGDPGGGTTPPCTPGTTEACYSGPQGTDGVGACVAGTMECNADGTGFGPCTGEVVPVAVDDCATPEDEDCDGVAPACPLETVWARGYIGGQLGSFPRITADAQGNVLVAGTFNTHLDFGGGNELVSAAGDDDDAFVLKLSPDGEYLWSKHLGGPGEQIIGGIGVDAAGNVLIAGTFDEQIDYGTGSIPSVMQSNDVFVVKLDGDGNLVWGRTYGGPMDELARALAVNAAGQVVVGGDFYGTVSFGSDQITAVGSRDVFVVRLAASGSQVVFARGFGSSDSDNLYGVATDSAGNTLVTGSFPTTIDFGTGPLTSAGNDDVFLAKLDGSGAAVQAQRFGDALNDVGFDVAVDARDNVLVTGLFEGIVSFGGDPLASVGANFFLAAYGPAGDHRFSQRFGENESSDHLAAVAVDPAGHVLLGGYFNRELRFGDDVLTITGPIGDDVDVFIAKLDSTGTAIAARSFGTPVPDGAFDVAVDAEGASFLVGVSLGGALDFGTGPLPVPVDADEATYFVVKLAP